MRRPRGKFVALALVALCAAGVWGTIRNYSTLHRTTTEVLVQSPGPPVAVLAIFPNSAGIEPGRHAIVSFESDPGRRWTGNVTDVRADRSVLIELHHAPATPAGTRGRATVDTTPGM